MKKRLHMTRRVGTGPRDRRRGAALAAAALFLLVLAASLLAAAPAEAGGLRSLLSRAAKPRAAKAAAPRRAPADGSGTVTVAPKQTPPDTLLNVSLLMSGTSTEQNIAEVVVYVPWAWNFSGTSSDVELAGSGFAFARVRDISGTGSAASPFRVRIEGASINTAKPGEIRLFRLRSPAFCAAAENPANIFKIETIGAGGVFQPVAASPGIATTGGGALRLLVNEVATRETNDFAELVVLDDGNGGAGGDLKGYSLGDMSQATADKTFGSLVVRTGDYVTLTYNSSAADETISASGAAAVFTPRTGLPDGDGQLLLRDPSGYAVDAFAYADMDGAFGGLANMLALIDLGQWSGVNEADAFDARNNKAGVSMQRNVYRRDTNRPADFELSNRPTKGAANTWAGVPYVVLIQEVAPEYGAGDFIELLVKDDGRGGVGLDLAGFTLTADSGRFSKTFGSLTVRTGDLVLLSFNASTADDTAAAGGVARVYTTYVGLNPAEGGIALVSPRLATVDFMAYARGELSTEARASLEAAVKAGAWLDSPPLRLYDWNDCVDARALTATSSLGRDRFGTDTDTRGDFALSANPTPGTENGAPLVVHALALAEGSPVVLRRGVERRLTLRAVDVNGNRVRASAHRVAMTSDSATARLSADGMVFNASAEKAFFEGELEFFLRDASAGRFTVSFETPDAAIPRLQVEVDVQDALDVKVNELMYRPSSAQTSHPDHAVWIELKNGDTVDRDLTGYEIDYGARRFTIPEGTVIARYGYLVVCRHLERSAHDEPPALADLYGDKDGDWELTDGFAAVEDPLMTLGAPGTVTLRTPAGLGVSSVAYESAMGGDGTGRSLERQDFSIESFGDLAIDRYNFKPSKDNEPYGTPGRQNSQDLSDPTALAITHVPVTSHDVLEPLYIHAEVTGATKVELYFRESENTVYRVRTMARVEGTNVYRAVILPEEILTERLEYYLRAGDATGKLVWHPAGGEDSPLPVTVVDHRNMIYVETPSKTIGENEEFLIRVKLRNQRSAITRLELVLSFDAARFTPLDAQSARPATQVEIGSAFSGYWASENAVTTADGRIRLTLENAAGTVKGDATLLTVRFKSQAVASAASATFGFVTALVNGATVESIRDGVVALDRVTEWIVGREGGVVTGSNGAELTIPENALLVPTGIRIRKLALEEIPATNVLDSQNGIVATRIAFEFLPSYTEFRRPVTLRLPFTTTELQYSNITAAENLRIYFWNHATLAWELVGGRVEGSKVAVEIGHFTVYLLVQDSRVLAPSVDRIAFSPNPFSPNGNGWNDVTALSFHLANNADVTVQLFDARGVRVRTLADRKRMFAGINKLEWDGADDFGQTVRTGVYLYRLKAVEADRVMVRNQGTVVVSRKMKDW